MMQETSHFPETSEKKLQGGWLVLEEKRIVEPIPHATFLVGLLMTMAGRFGEGSREVFVNWINREIYSAPLFPGYKVVSDSRA